MITHKLFALSVLCATLAYAADRWEIRYFHDEDSSSLTIADIGFFSEKHGVAVGVLAEGDKKQGSLVRTSDGGGNWEIVPFKETPLSIYALDDSIGWIVTDKSIWKTDESGRAWRKIAGLEGVQRVFFLDASRGWAVGPNKAIYETSDGGSKWTKVAAASEPKTKAENTTYSWITFATKNVGMITGWSSPPRRTESAFPGWLDPQSAEKTKTWPHLSITLETRDAGKTWTPDTVSMFGHISRVRLGPTGQGLALIEFAEAFDWPSEVYRLDLRTGQSTRAFREKTQAITDVALGGDGFAYLAGYEVPGTTRITGIPGKLRVFRSSDLQNWDAMEVDYRGVANRATLAKAGADLWIATDTGMILKLAR